MMTRVVYFNKTSKQFSTKSKSMKSCLESLFFFQRNWLIDT